MSALYAGLLCTLLLIGAIAALFGCMSAARCLRRSSFALCLAITGLDFAPLAAFSRFRPPAGLRCALSRAVDGGGAARG